MSNYSEKLETLINLGFPVINVTTIESNRAQTIFADVANQTKKKLVVMGFKDLPTPPFFERLINELETENNSKNGDVKRSIIVFDPMFFERQKVNHEVLPGLKASLTTLETNGINYIISGKDSLDEEFVYHTDVPSMTTSEIELLLEECESYLKKGQIFSADERKEIANNARGLSHSQMKNVFTYCSYLKVKGLDYLSEIRKEKAHILRDVGLDVMEAIGINDVGGLENLKKFLSVRKSGWDKDLPLKGILMAGVPGCGKTLTAKATAGYLGTTLVRMDLSRFYNKYIGETERQFSRALQTVEQISPVVLMIDEMEKFFGSGEGEHEVSKRLLGTFLYWLQERKGKVFIVATANRIHALPPELIRAGRWDRTFFVDLPTQVERLKIFQIHLKKADTSLSHFDLNELVDATQGYTGAEIEQAVIDAQYVAVSEEHSLDQQTLLNCIREITPTSETRKDDINQIRNLKNQGFYPANDYEKETTKTSDSTRFVSID